jgi:hypothetical protein
MAFLTFFLATLCRERGREMQEIGGDHSDDVDHRSEGGIGRFVACSDASKRLDGAEEVLDKMAPLVLFPRHAGGVRWCPRAAG